MAITNIVTAPAAGVPSGGTITVPYPSEVSYDPGYLVKLPSAEHVAILNSNNVYSVASGKVSMAFSSQGIVVTNITGRTWYAGETVQVDLRTEYEGVPILRAGSAIYLLGAASASTPAYFPSDLAMPITYSQLPSTSASTMGAGARIRLTNLRNTEWVSDGTNWKPAGGRQTLYMRQGSLAAPLATMTGTGVAQQFTTPDTLLIPAGLISQHMKVYGEVIVRKAGTAQAFTMVTSIGTANSVASAADPSFVGQTLPITDNYEVRLFGSAQYFSASPTAGFLSTGSLAPNTAPTTVQQTLKTANQNTAADMHITIGCSVTNFIAPDTATLTGYHFWIEG